MSNTGDPVIDTWDDRFIPTGNSDIEISNGDSVERLEDKYNNPTDVIVYSKDLGTFKLTNPDDSVYTVDIYVETGDGYNYIHFEYDDENNPIDGGAGFSLRIPAVINNIVKLK
tara:strand:- start:278 stop:616 length:339 start_codon:yes stop_codon:yes gene_type:complete